jgi:hypothetical protein
MKAVDEHRDRGSITNDQLDEIYKRVQRELGSGPTPS